MKKFYISILLIGFYSINAEAQWNIVAPMSTTRAEHVSVALSNNKVLVAGGWNYVTNLNSAELYDGSANTWTPAGTMSSYHSTACAVLLANGKVLVIGGYTGTANTDVCELYNPATNTWGATGSLSNARSTFTATLLQSGKVLVAGGYNGSVNLTACELYDPASGTWSSGGSLTTGRSYHTATLLNSGKVLVAGGFDGNDQQSSTEIYDPGTNSWSAGPSLSNKRDFHGASKLANGTVMVSGGRFYKGVTSGSAFQYYGLTSVEIYNPTANTWSPGVALPAGLSNHQQITLNDGNVLAIAGLDSSVAPNGNLVVTPGTTSVFDTTAGIWSAAIMHSDGRYEFGASLMTDGRAIVTGGVDQSVELYGIATGIMDHSNNLSSLSVYPNPSSGVINITTGVTNQNYALTVTDMLGQPVEATIINKNGGLVRLQLNVRDGVYFVRIETKENISVKKITIIN